VQVQDVFGTRILSGHAHAVISYRRPPRLIWARAMTLRPIIFWSHLVAGVTAGIVILIMSFTGVVLMYERQMIAWSDRQFRSAPSSPGAARLPIDTVVARVREAQPDQALTAVTVNSDPLAPIAIAAGRRTFFADAYSGAVLGERSRNGLREFLATVREWHRWLAMSGDNRPIAKAITGWANALFLFVVVSGFYIWLPRVWTRASVRAVALFNGRLSGKARDFNWHNAIGLWCCVPLFFVVITAMPISFPWANALIFRAVGEAPPSPAPPGGGGAPPAGQRAARRSQQPSPEGERSRSADRQGGPVAIAASDALWATAMQRMPGWRTVSLRMPTSPDLPMVFTIDRGDGGQPQLRSTLTLNAAGQIVREETFASQSLGRRIRSLSRFTHTGEVLGLPGQTIAGIASAGGVALVYTGLALAYRRFRSWLKRRGQVRADSLDRSARTNAA
jgi:uncharacterized iron-regulated membrane protein